MILIDAIYVNTGGGKVLLDYLIEELDKTNFKIFYLLDNRIRKNHRVIKASNEVYYLNSDIYSRYKFYKQNKLFFNSILCLGNIPPIIKLNCTVYTYFHNTIYFKTLKEYPFIERLKYIFKVFIINRSKSNTNYWWVQTQLVKEKFQEIFNEDNVKVKLMPFYPVLNSDLLREYIKKKYTYLYVSTGTPNKNHIRLINGFCKFYDKYEIGSLTLTVGNQYENVLYYINKKILEGYPIINIGYVQREKLIDQYKTSEYLIFPSLSESFGLGILEGIEFNCKILCSDLPYAYEVCQPSLVFNPYDENSIYLVLEKTVNEFIEPSSAYINNSIAKIVEKLST